MPYDANIWFSSGLLLAILGIFITEKNFTSPVDVMVNIITALVVLYTLDDKGGFRLWGSLMFYSVTVGLIAMISFLFIDDNKDRGDWTQRVAKSTNAIASFLGSSKFLFSIIFIISIFNYFVFSIEKTQNITQQQLAIIYLIIFWGAMIFIEPIDRKLIQPIVNAFTKKISNSLIGRISSRQAPNIIIAEQFPNSPEIKIGDLAVINTKNTVVSSVSKGDNLVLFIGFHESDASRFLKFYSISSDISDISKQIFVHKINDLELPEVQKIISDNDFYNKRERMIGFIHTGSDIDTIKIRMIDGVDEEKDLKNGDLVSVSFHKMETKYQIINVQTNIESVDGDSKAGSKIITAQQIGSWDKEKQKFIDNGWVPAVNTPVHLENEAEKIEVIKKEYYKVGYVPKSGYPISINLEEGVNHHIAMIGKTGTGKSYMSAKIIEKLVENDYKVIVLEIDQENKQSLSKYINSEKISLEKVVWSSESKTKMISGRSSTYDEWTAKINFESEDRKNIFLINWDNNSKTQDDGPLSQADGAIAVIMSVLAYQRKNPESKICIVMEEAYDFIPENNFGQQDFGQPAVSRISQLVLKCRKHNVGFFIITQRTALVSKTILHQCHTIIALQSFDETSKNFMSSYVNQKYLDGMSILPRFRAMIVGKGSSCDKPIVVDFYDETAKEPAIVIQEEDKEKKKEKSLVIIN